MEVPTAVETSEKRPPCTRYVEVELVGACWAPHELKAPCPETLFKAVALVHLLAFVLETGCPGPAVLLASPSVTLGEALSAGIDDDIE